jgi:hypothetical protein
MHACPGYEMGLGATLGILTAVLEAGEFEPNPTPLVAEFSVFDVPRPRPPRVADVLKLSQSDAKSVVQPARESQ